MEIRRIVQAIEESANRYGLKILHMDATDVTVVARIGLSDEIFMQLYANLKKQKKSITNIAKNL